MASSLRGTPPFFVFFFCVAKVTNQDSRGRVSPFCFRLCQKKRATVSVCVASMCDSFLQREAVWQL